MRRASFLVATLAVLVTGNAYACVGNYGSEALNKFAINVSSSIDYDADFPGLVNMIGNNAVAVNSTTISNPNLHQGIMGELCPFSRTTLSEFGVAVVDDEWRRQANSLFHIYLRSANPDFFKRLATELTALVNGLDGQHFPGKDGAINSLNATIGDVSGFERNAVRHMDSVDQDVLSLIFEAKG